MSVNQNVLLSNQTYYKHKSTIYIKGIKYESKILFIFRITGTEMKILKFV